MSARLKSAGQTGTHCRHWVQAVTKETTLGLWIVGRCTASFSSAMLTYCDSTNGQASMQSWHPMHATSSASTCSASSSLVSSTPKDHVMGGGASTTRCSRLLW